MMTTLTFCVRVITCSTLLVLNTFAKPLFIDESFDYQVCMENYELGKKLGEGGFGQVFLATETSSGKKVAIKLLSVLDHPLSPHMMNKEIEALAKLKHKHIVKLFRWLPLPKKH